MSTSGTPARRFPRWVIALIALIVLGAAAVGFVALPGGPELTDFESAFRIGGR